MLCRLEWRPAAGRRISNALIPNVGSKAVNAEDQNSIRWSKYLCSTGLEEMCTEGERERERGAKNTKFYYNQKYNHLVKGYKVTLYSD